MDVALWIVAGVLASAFLVGGLQKLTRSREQLAASGLTFVEDFSDGAVRAIGALEVLAAVGLVLPAAIGVLPVVVALAACGVVALMIGAVLLHQRRGEHRAIVVNLVFLLLAAVVAVGRLAVVPFSA